MAKIGWIGTGVMGASMAGHLLAAGNSLTVYNRTKEKTQVLVDKGAIYGSVQEIATNCDIIFTIIGTPQDVREVYLGAQGLVAGGKSGQTFVDMTTTEPSLTKEIFHACSEKGIEFLDAPVSGGDIGARNATLAIMVGGEQAVFDKMLPLLQLMGKNIVYEGQSGAGQHTKMCNQIVIAGNMIGMCESLVYSIAAGLDTQKVVDIISKGAAGSWSLDNLAPRILRGEYDTGFYVKHFVKDMGIALKEAKNMGLNLPGLTLVHELYTSLITEGGENLGTQGLMKVLKKMNNIS